MRAARRQRHGSAASWFDKLTMRILLKADE